LRAGLDGPVCRAVRHWARRRSPLACALPSSGCLSRAILQMLQAVQHLLHSLAAQSRMASMDCATLTGEITRSIDTLPGEMAAAARYVLRNPGDVALLSMREQARRAGVRPWTMTRLAKRFGLDGYETVRRLHGEALKERALGFSGKA